MMRFEAALPNLPVPTLVETAATPAGESEELLGALLHEEVPRRDVVLALRVGARGTGRYRRPDGSRRTVLADLDLSLARLRTDHVDLLLLEGSGDAPVEEQLSALEEAVRSGRARYVGVAEHGAWQLARAAALAPAGAPLVAAQAELSLVARWADGDLLDAAEASGVGVLARSPLGGGVLTGKYRHATPSDSRGASPQWSGFIDGLRSKNAERVVEAVITAAQGLNTVPLAVALAWLRDRPGVVAPVVGARTAAQLQVSLDAEDVTLPAAIRRALDDVSAPHTSYPDRRPG